MTAAPGWCAVCTLDLPPRPINAPYWIADPAEPPFGGHWERRDLCGMACVKAAPRYVAPRKPRKPRPQPVAYGDWGMVGMFLSGKRN